MTLAEARGALPRIALAAVGGRMRLVPWLLVLAWLVPTSAEAGALSQVTKCDIKRLNILYERSTGATKRELRKLAKGSKILETEMGMLPEAVYYELLSAQKVPANCRFAQTRYTYADAEVLAGIWQTTPAGAKKIVEEKIAAGYEYGVTDALMGQQKLGVDDPKTDPSLEAFWASEDYTYCDARMLAESWGTDPYIAKKLIGAKVASGLPAARSSLDQMLLPARQQAIANRRPCAWGETDFSYEDAVKLAGLWRMPMDSVKARVAEMVGRGQNRAILETLRGR